MLHIAATLHTFGVKVADRVRARLTETPERGNVTIEHVLWAVAVIAIVGTVVTVITGYVRTEANKIGG